MECAVPKLRNSDGVTACFVNFSEFNNFRILKICSVFVTEFCITFPGKAPSTVPSTSKKVITNKTVLPPVVVKQEFAHAKRPTNHNNNNIPSHLDVPKKLPSAKKSPPPEIKMENNGIKMEGELSIMQNSIQNVNHFVSKKQVCENC